MKQKVTHAMPNHTPASAETVNPATPLELGLGTSQPNPACGWVGPLPTFKTSSFCDACQLNRSAGQIARCRIKGGPESTEEKTTPQIPVVKPEITHTIKAPRFFSGLGDCFKARAEKRGIKQKPGCPCKDLQNSLNQSTPEYVTKNLDVLVEEIFKNVKDIGGMIGVGVQLFSWLAPEEAKSQIRKMLQDCLDSATEVSKETPPNAPESSVEPPE